MPVSSLVLHLSAEPHLRLSVEQALAARPEFFVGPAARRLLPVALQTHDEQENKACWRWVNGLPGVDFVEVLSVVFTAPSQGPSSDHPSRSSRAG